MAQTPPNVAPLPQEHAEPLRAASLKTTNVVARLRGEATHARVSAAPGAPSPAIARLRARPESAAEVIEASADPDAAARAVAYVAFAPWSCDGRLVLRALAGARGRPAHGPLLAALGARSDAAAWARTLGAPRGPAAFLRAAVAEASLLACPEWLVAEAAVARDRRFFGERALAPAFAAAARPAAVGADLGAAAPPRAAPLALAWASADAADRFARSRPDRRAAARRVAALQGDLARFLDACRAWRALDAGRFTGEALDARRRALAAPPAPPALEGHWCATRAELRALGDAADAGPAGDLVVGAAGDEGAADAADADAADTADAEAQARRVAHAWAEARRRRAAVRAAAAALAAATTASRGGAPAAALATARSRGAPAAARAAPRYARPTEAWAAAPRRRSLGDLRPDEQRRYFEDMLRRPWRDVDAGAAAPAPAAAAPAATPPRPPAAAYATFTERGDATPADDDTAADDDDDAGFDPLALTRSYSERAGGYGDESDGEADDAALAYVEFSGGEDSGDSVDAAAPAAAFDSGDDAYGSEDDAGAAGDSDDGTASTASEAAPPPDETSEAAPPAAPTPDGPATAYAGELFTKHAGHWCRVAARLVADVDGAGPGLLDGDRPLVLLDGCAVAASQRTDLGATPGRFFLAVTDAGGARRELACASVVERDVWVNAMQSALDAWAVAAAARAPPAPAPAAPKPAAPKPAAPKPAAPPPNRRESSREVRGLALLAPPGVRVLKHCRHAKPHACFLMVDVHGAHLAWTKKRAQSQQGSVPIAEISDVTVGLATAVLARHGVPERADRYLSIVTRFRTLDVECESVAVRDDLAAAVDFLRDVE